MSSPSTIYTTFLASVKSVGTAYCMAMVGLYLHQRGYISSPGKRTLALISQQVTFPLFLFTKIIYCNQDWSTQECPDVTKTLANGWMLLFWPFFVVMSGLLVGRLMARLSNTPVSQHKSVWAAIAFGNSTGLPITLLTVVHSNFPVTSDLGRVDPTLFLSVYLLLYPVLQWGIGGWLLAPDKKLTEENHPVIAAPAAGETDTQGTESDVEEHQHYYESIRDTVTRNVLNLPSASHYFENRQLASNDEGIYLSEVNLAQVCAQAKNDAAPSNHSADTESVGLDYSRELDHEEKPLLKMVEEPSVSYQSSPAQSRTGGHDVDEARSRRDNGVLATLNNIVDRCLQPPVVGALLGIFVAVIHPLRGLFVDLVDRNSSAPLEWIFDGLYNIGQAAVPVNMIILGCNLSSSINQYTGKDEKVCKDGLFSKSTLISIVFGKMILMPVIGILSAVFLRFFVLNVPPQLEGSFYLVLMIVFLTPTANNVMVIVELSGANAKEGIASVIALQYAVAPVILSLTMSVAIGVASQWS